MIHLKSKKTRLALAAVVIVSNAIAVKYPSCQFVSGIVDAIALIAPDFK